MTREKAKDILPFITAYVEGKTVQFKTGAGEWATFDMRHIFGSAKREFRIKPEPEHVLMTTDDLPPVARLKEGSTGIVERVTRITAKKALCTENWQATPETLQYVFTWSTDRKTWHSFMKEVAE